MNNRIMAQAVQAQVKSKFRGRTALKSKVVPHFPDSPTREYMRITNAYMTMLRKTLAKHLPTIRKAINAEGDSLLHHDSDIDMQALISKTFFDVEDEFIKMATDFGIRRKLKKLAHLNRKLTIKEWKRVVYKTLGINILEDYYMGGFFRESINQWVTSNVNLIKTIPENTLTEMENIVLEGYMSGRSNTDIGKDVESAYGMNRRHAQFIARDQMAKLNAALTKAQQQDAGIEEYVWSTSGDERVRDRHKELDGKKFRWNDPPIVDEKSGRRCHPGEDYQCRCVALPVFNLPELDLPWEKGKE